MISSAFAYFVLMVYFLGKTDKQALSVARSVLLSVWGSGWEEAEWLRSPALEGWTRLLSGRSFLGEIGNS